MRQKELTEYQSNAKCPTCGKEYKNQHGMRIHHAQVHGEKLGIVTKTCVICNSEYETIEIRSDNSNYCSNECKSLGRRNRVTKTCEICGENFDVAECESHQRFCDIDCRAEWMRQVEPEKSPAWNGGGVTLNCEACGDDFNVPEHQKDFRVTCSFDCYGDYRSQFPPEEHPMYRGGGGRHFYEVVRRSLSDERWASIRERVRQRDGECKLCGAEPEELDRTLHSHHIIPVMGGGCNADELQMALCSSCHQTVEAYTYQFTDQILVPECEQ